VKAYVKVVPRSEDDLNSRLAFATFAMRQFSETTTPTLSALELSSPLQTESLRIRDFAPKRNQFSQTDGLKHNMDDFVSDTDSDYTSYWRDWVSTRYILFLVIP